MGAFLESMSGAEVTGFIVYLSMTIAFFLWIAYLAISK